MTVADVPSWKEVVLVSAAVLGGLLVAASAATFGLAALLRALAGDKARGVMLALALLLAGLALVYVYLPTSVGASPRFLVAASLLTLAAVMGVFLLARRAPDLRRRP